MTNQFYGKMLAGFYEKDSARFEQIIAKKAEQNTAQRRKFLEMKYINPILLKELIEKIEIFNIEGSGKSKTQRIVIHYKFLGILDVPNEFSGNNVVIEPREGVAVEYLPVQGKIA